MAYPKAEVKAGRLSLIAFVFLSIVLAGLFRLQVMNGAYYRDLSEKNRLRVLYLEPARGKILDRFGRVMASSRLSYNCSVIPREAKNTIRETVQVLSPILGEEPEKLEKMYKRAKPGAYGSVILAEDIPPAQAMAIEEMIDTMPGVYIETRPQREYEYAESAAHLVGYIGPMTEAERDDLDEEQHRATDWVGREGLEKYYENYLHGRAGGIQMEVNSRGRFLRTLGVREPREGRDIRLTVDAELQRLVQSLISGKKASVIVMELAEGGVLSMNSSPSFDPNLFASTRGRKEVGPYLKDESAPLLNRGIAGQYPPGSIFKIVTAMAGLEKGKLRMQSSFHCPGYFLIGKKRFGCWQKAGHGQQGLVDAMAHSCDVFFYLAGLSAGGESIAAKALEFGFGQKCGIDLPGERAGLVPSRDWKKRRKQQGWFDGDTANFSIGQGFLLVTPIQALVMAGAAATGGDRLVPHLIDQIDGQKVAERHGLRIRMTPEYIEVVRRGLDAVVNTETGTGRLSRLPGIRIAGKTGTAQSGQEEDHAWFIGYAPAREPRIAMVVFVEHGGHGGVTAAGIARDIWHYLKGARYL